MLPMITARLWGLGMNDSDVAECVCNPERGSGEHGEFQKALLFDVEGVK